jgi:hypothetical protein
MFSFTDFLQFSSKEWFINAILNISYALFVGLPVYLIMSVAPMSQKVYMDFFMSSWSVHDLYQAKVIFPSFFES